MRTRGSLAAAILGCLLCGCAAQPERLPVYHWTDSATALRILAQRADSVRTASAECLLTLTRPNGESVRLDGALVMKQGGFVRLRAWKFGQAVFDLTLRPDGLWLVAPSDAGQRQKVVPASLSAAKMARAWSVLSGEFFQGADMAVHDTGGRQFRVERTLDQQRIVCDIDRATLTPRRYAVVDPSGKDRFVLTISRYEQITGIVWPVRLRATSENGQIAINLKNVELNGDVPPSAFTPPRRAERLP